MTAMLNYWMLSSRALLLFGLLPVLAGSVVGLQGWLWNRDAAAFVENLRGVEGRVLLITPDAGGLLVDVEYLNETGVPYTKQFKVDSRQEAELRAVGKVSLVYDLRYPQVAELGHVVSANDEKTMYMAMTAAGGLLCLIGIFVIAKRALETAQTLALFRSGTLIKTEVRDSAMSPGKATGRFTYAFRGPNGRWYEGKSPEMGTGALNNWPVGRRILVAYDPANPRQSEVDVFGMVNEKRRGEVLAA